MKQRIESGATNASIAAEFGTSERSVSRFRVRHGINPAGVQRDYTTIKGDKAEGSVTTEQILDDPDKMLRMRGLKPEDWEITHLTANEYQGPNSKDAVAGGAPAVLTYYQTKFTATKKRPEVQIVAASREPGWIPPRFARPAILREEPVMWVLTGDQQAPFHDPVLHGKFQAWLAHYRPQRGLLLGDTIDFPDVSRHRLDPENTATVNECIQSGADLLLDYVGASPDTEWDLIEGNHDERLRNLILDKPSLRPIYGIQRARLNEEEPVDVLGVRHLLRLDELGINYVSSGGKYDLTEVALSQQIAARHGWIVRNGSGASALESIKSLGYSLAVGHTHRQSIVAKTFHGIDRRTKTLYGIETGCMCRVSQEIGPDGRIWPNYAVAPDWQQGFAVVTVWPDGSFTPELATFTENRLLFRNEWF